MKWQIFDEPTSGGSDNDLDFGATVRRLSDKELEQYPYGLFKVGHSPDVDV